MASMEQLFGTGALARCGTLLHLAWSSLPTTAEQHPELVETQDLPFLRRLLEAITAVPASQRPHLVFFSSGGAVYGNAPGRSNGESDPCRPIGQYGRAKRAAEMLIESWADKHEFSHTILRISNPYGFTVHQERPQGIIPHAIRCALAGTPLTLWGDGTARKDFIHSTDFLAALARVLEERPSGTFNLCSGESHSLNEVLAEVERQTGRPIARILSPAAVWDVHDSRLANDRLRAASGWEPAINLREGIRLSVAGNLAPP